MKTFLSVLLLVALSASSQEPVMISIKQLPASHPQADAIYLAGSFNGWNPADPAYRFEQTKNGSFSIALSLPAGDYEYKITRGSWETGECTKDGNAIPNRQLKLPAGNDIEVSIAEWSDKAPKPVRRSTTGRNVRIIDTAFSIPQLNRTRRIWIYIPEYQGSKKFPVLYMHDGQNLFDDATSFSGEWGMDEFMDSVRTNQCIIVGIDNGGESRMREYNPYDNARFGKAEGDAYVDFIVKTLKPYIDKHYPTKKQKEHTYIAGSSMGGLISLFAILKYPKTFGGAGVFSPSLWIAPDLYSLMKEKGEKFKGAIYFYAGKNEGDEMVSDALKAFSTLSRVSKAVMTVSIRNDGKHNEASWRRELPCFYYWIRYPQPKARKAAIRRNEIPATNCAEASIQ